ncbi:MAG: hypothetical protein QNJ62_07445 [Methyloceanibacter sp.]|nr:hypothetical protein [Methyloceanibacter sp.]
MLLEAIMFHDGKTNVKWTITPTVASEQGNTLIDSLQDNAPGFVDELEYSVTRGATKPWSSCQEEAIPCE